MFASETYIEEGDDDYDGDPAQEKDRDLEIEAIEYIEELLKERSSK